MKLVVIALVSMVGIVPALADDPPPPTYTYGKKDDVKDVKDVSWTAKGELGVVSTTGNSRTTTVSAGANAIRKDKDNKLELTVVGTYARARIRIVDDANGNGVIDSGELTEQSTTSAESALAKLRYDRYLTGTDALYAAGFAGVDVPAGKDFIGGGQGGYSRSLWRCMGTTAEGKEELRQQVLGEVGYDISYIQLSAGSSTTIHSGRAFLGYKGKFKDTTLEASVEALFNINGVDYGMRHAGGLEDTRIAGIVGFTTTLSTKLSLAASFAAKFENFPPPLAKIGMLPFASDFVPVSDKLDTITKVSLIFKFL